MPNSTSAWNIANALTALRVAAVPLLGYLLLHDSQSARNWATLVFLLASLTDFLDGFVARKYGLITTLGKIADPIADKFLTGVALIGLSYLGALPWWVTIVIITREIGVTLVRFWVIEHGVISASRGGKTKTLAQIIAISMYLVEWPTSVPESFLTLWDVSKISVMALAVILTLGTAIAYVRKATQLRKEIEVVRR
ncbi:CDP-diacylglycerol--glycerol-3-phosphate 3-phosphatidyltransferase [Actinomycetota bacterium]|nr:CDP-diacylglycerol--glycerol-3-phosphate 3-phosphatidyltransferase [Actinomycetota bacterium]